MNRWFEIKLREGIKCKKPFKYAKKGDNGSVLLVTDKYYCDILPASVVKKEYYIIRPAKDQDYVEELFDVAFSR